MRANGPEQLYPFLRVAPMFAVGLLVGEAFCGPTAQTAYLAAVAALLGVYFCFRRRPVAQTLTLFVAIVAVGAWRMASFVGSRDVALADGPVETRVVVMSRPVVKGKVVRLDAVGVGGQCNGRLVRVALLRSDGRPCADSVRVGDGLVLWSQLEAPANYPSAAGRRSQESRGHFDYAQWMRTHGFVAQTFVLPGNWRCATLELGSIGRVQRLRLVALRLRERLLHMAGEGLDGETSAVVTAMALGEKTALGRDLRDRYSVSGVSHLLALSGLHLSVIYMVLSFLFVRRRWNVWGQAVAVAAIWAYVLLVGMPPSVVRAAIMITLCAAGAVMGSKAVVGNNIGIAATLMMFFNPYCLWDVGFQLSFVAVLSIFALFGPLYRVIPAEWLFCHRVGRWAWTMTCVSVAAQIGVTPLVLYYFGRFSCYFLLTNFVAIPLATLVVYLALAFFCLSFVPYVSAALATCLSAVVAALDWVVGAVAALPGSSIEELYVSKLQVCLLYFVIGCLCFVARYLWILYCFYTYRVRR